MNDLLESVIQAHGGMRRWNDFETLEATVVFGGGLFALKDVILDASPSRVTLWLHEMRSILHFGGDSNARSICSLGRIALEQFEGEPVAERWAPRDSFGGHQMNTPWDALHHAYFVGESLWTSLTTPFLLVREDVRVEEIDAWHEGRETWRVLRAYFPNTMVSRSLIQDFFFDDDLMLRRHDYNLAIAGSYGTAQLPANYVTVSGIAVPTSLRAHARGPDRRPIVDMLMVSMEITEPSSVSLKRPASGWQSGRTLDERRDCGNEVRFFRGPYREARFRDRPSKSQVIPIDSTRSAREGCMTSRYLLLYRRPTRSAPRDDSRYRFRTIARHRDLAVPSRRAGAMPTVTVLDSELPAHFAMIDKMWPQGFPRVSGPLTYASRAGLAVTASHDGRSCVGYISLGVPCALLHDREEFKPPTYANFSEHTARVVAHRGGHYIQHLRDFGSGLAGHNEHEDFGFTNGQAVPLDHHFDRGESSNAFYEDRIRRQNLTGKWDNTHSRGLIECIDGAPFRPSVLLKCII